MKYPLRSGYITKATNKYNNQPWYTTGEQGRIGEYNMIGLHTSYRLAPYPGVGKCAAKTIACPVGGAQQHLYNDYLSDEAKQALAEGRSLTKAQMVEAIQKAKATPGSRLQLLAASYAQHNMMMHGYLLNSVGASHEKLKNTASQLSGVRDRMKKITTERVGESDLSQNLVDAYGAEEGKQKFTELVSNPELQKQADAHKSVLSEYSRRYDMQTNSNPINNKVERDEDGKKIQDGESDKWYARAMGNTAKEADLKLQREELLTAGESIPDSLLAPEFKWGEGMQKKMEGALFIPNTSVKGKVEVGSGANKRIEERDVSFKELVKRKEYLDQQKANKESAQNRLAMMLAVSTNDRIRNGEALGDTITLTAHGRQVTAKIDYAVPNPEEIEKLPVELQEKITIPNSPTLTVSGLRAALEDGRITQEQFNALTNPSNELNIVSLRDIKAAAKKNSLKLPDPDPNKSPNNAKHMAQEMNKVLTNYAETVETFEEETGHSVGEEEKWVKESVKAVKDGIAEEYNTPNLNFIAGAEGRGAGTSIVQSTKHNIISAAAQEQVLGPEAFAALVKDYGKAKAKVDVKEMKKHLTPEQFDLCTGYGVKISDVKDPKLEAKEKKQAEQAAAKKQREADRKKAATAKRREAEAAKKRAAAERKKVATAKKREAEAAKKKAAAERKKAATAAKKATATKATTAKTATAKAAPAKKATAPKTAAPKVTTAKASAPKPAATKAAPAKKATAPKASAPKAPAAPKATTAKAAAKTATAKATAPKAPAAPKATPAAKQATTKTAAPKATAPKAAPAKKATAPKTATKPAATKATTAKAPAAPKAETPAS